MMTTLRNPNLMAVLMLLCVADIPRRQREHVDNCNYCGKRRLTPGEFKLATVLVDGDGSSVKRMVCKDCAGNHSANDGKSAAEMGRTTVQSELFWLDRFAESNGQ